MKMKTTGWDTLPSIHAGFVDEHAIAAATPTGITVSSNWLRKLLTFAMVMGPGLIVMEADNDAGYGWRSALAAGAGGGGRGREPCGTRHIDPHHAARWNQAGSCFPLQ
jgi:hypothetical protein